LRFRPKPSRGKGEPDDASAASLGLAGRRGGTAGAAAWARLNLTVRLENATEELVEAGRRFSNPTLSALGRWLATTRARSAAKVAATERFERNFSCTLSPAAQWRMARGPPYGQDFLQYGYRLEPGG